LITAGPGSQGRQPRAHQRAADRRDERRASLGRPVWRLARRHFRPSGQGGLDRRRGHRPALQAAETARSANRPTSDLTAYDLYLRAYEMYFASAQLIPDALHLLSKRSNAIR
jgi:hypothetical protein